MEENKNETPEQPKFTVKEVTGEEKSRAEVEEQLLAKHEEKFADSKPKEEEVEKDEEVREEAPVSEINDADVLKYIKNRYDKDIDSVEGLFDQKNSNEDLPEDVSAYFKYKKDVN